MTKKFKLRSCPKPPVRKRSVRMEDDIDDCTGASVLSTLQVMKERGIDLKQVIVEAESEEMYYGQWSTTAKLKWNEDESMKDFAARVTTYNKRLATYTKWAEDNKEAIARRKMSDEAAKEEKEDVAKEREIFNLEMKLKKLKRKK
jgi:hypothetical protein